MNFKSGTFHKNVACIGHRLWTSYVKSSEMVLALLLKRQYLLRAAVDLLQVWAEVGLWGLQRPGRKQGPFMKQVDWHQGLHLQLWHTAEPPQSRRQLGHVWEGLRRPERPNQTQLCLTSLNQESYILKTEHAHTNIWWCSCIARGQCEHLCQELMHSWYWISFVSCH